MPECEAFGEVGIAKDAREFAAALDFAREKAVQKAVRLAVRAGALKAAHDCSDGGLAVALLFSLVVTPTVYAMLSKDRAKSKTPSPQLARQTG